VADEDGPGQVIEASAARPAVVALPLGLGAIRAVLDDLRGGAMGTGDTVGPATITDRLEALGVVDRGWGD
jgi:hypothetical protein